MRGGRLPFVVAPCILTSAVSLQPSALRSTETLRSVAALPAHVAGTFEDIAACHLSPEGDYLIFDRRAHAVFSVPRDGEPRKIIDPDEAEEAISAVFPDIDQARLRDRRATDARYAWIRRESTRRSCVVKAS